MTAPRVVHVRSKEWKDAPWNRRMYIGRKCKEFDDSFFMNQYRIGDKLPDGRIITRGLALELYEEEWRGLLENFPEIYIPHFKLLGQMDVIGCWCHPKPCHGDILVELWEKYVGGSNG